MMYPTVGRWLTEDPEGFTAQDMDLYRYCGDDPTNATDPTGLDFKFVDNKMVLSAQLEVEWVDGKTDKWNDEEEKTFQKKVKEQVEAIWNGSPFVLVSKDGKKQYVPQIDISFVNKFTNSEHKYNLRVFKDVLADRAEAYVKGQTLTCSSANALMPQQNKFVPQEGEEAIAIEHSIMAHEFGHLLGLPHPGAFIGNPEEFIHVYSPQKVEGETEKGANSPAAYEADPYSLMGRGSEMRWWMFEKWANSLNETKPDDGPWTIKIDRDFQTSIGFWIWYAQLAKLYENAVRRVLGSCKVTPKIGDPGTKVIT